MKVVVWVCILISILLFQYTLEPFDIKKPLITKTYNYPSLDIYPYDALPIIDARSPEDTFTVKNITDLTTSRSAKIYTCFVISSPTEDATKFSNLKKKYDDYMKSSTNMLKIKEYKAPPSLSLVQSVQVKSIPMELYSEKAILNPTMFVPFIAFTGVTDSMVRAWIAEVLERALASTAARNGVCVSILLYSNIPDSVDTAFPPYYYIQRIVNYPILPV